MSDLNNLSLAELVERYYEATKGTPRTAEPYLEGVEALTVLLRKAEQQRAALTFVAVMEGASWSQAGARLGMSKQAAHERYRVNAMGITPEEARREREERRRTETPILCAHADQGGQGMHWLAPGETCSARTDERGRPGF